MNLPIIETRYLSKRYLLDHQAQEAPRTFRDVMVQGSQTITNTLLRPGRRRRLPSAQEEFWALKDISFDIQPGQRVGIIGRNGAGKSTLLKILSRITEPTQGSIAIRGRVASLLEVGTGFHPELTGRENIFLNGAILGMGQEEIRRKFDEIVAFAEVDRFLDTPVKRYSSGMYVRLAFAVAAHLEPEVLIVDEVLAVGDMAFQEKCLGKMQDVAGEGRTVLFVSHNMGVIETLCDRCILLDRGMVKADGAPKDMTELYISQSRQMVAEGFEHQTHKPFTFLNAALCNTQGDNISWVDEGQSACLHLSFRLNQPLKGAEIGIQAHPQNSQDVLFATALSDCLPAAATELAAGDYTAQLTLPGTLLRPGIYYFSLFAHIPHHEWLDHREHALRLTVKSCGLTDPRKYVLEKCGHVRLEGDWDLRQPDAQVDRVQAQPLVAQAQR